MAGGGFVFEPTGTCGVRIITTLTYVVLSNGDGVVSDELVCINTAFVPCTATIEASGDESVPIGTCGGVIITTRKADGDGAATAESGITCIVIASTTIGMERVGLQNDDIGKSTGKTITATSCMANTGGSGENIDELAAQFTANAF